MIRQYLIPVFLCLVAAFPAHSHADNGISGTYVYDTYVFTSPDGQSSGLEALGAKGASLEIINGNAIRMTMHMRDGSDHVSNARILELHLDQGGGYWIAQWPEMTYPVRKDFRMDGGTFSYVIRFDDPTDVYRYGGMEQGVLRRVSAPAGRQLRHRDH
jgi:hypothetical protein